MPTISKRIAHDIGAGILPDNGVVVGLAGVPIPDQRCLPLIGYADGCHISGGQICLFQGTTNDVAGVFPDFQGIMLHPPWPGIILFVFDLMAAAGFSDYYYGGLKTGAPNLRRLAD